MAKKYLNPNLNKGAFAQKIINVDDLVNRLLKGDRSALSSAITIIESDHIDDRSKASEILQKINPIKTNSLRIAISGSPGVGKSSFIEALTKFQDKTPIAVLAIDPSSSQSHGSILGDKTRMESLVTRENAFVRPSPAGKTLGGVTAKTKETILLCEAAGFEKIIVETVGVGQSETAVSNMVDLFILLILPGSGDEVQGIKRGIVELADMILITKNDGERLDLARASQRAYKNAIHLFRQKYADWIIPVFPCSAYENQNMDKVWNYISDFEAFAQKNHWKNNHRKEQQLHWYDQCLQQKAMNIFMNKERFKSMILEHRLNIQNGENDIWKLINEFK